MSAVIHVERRNKFFFSFTINSVVTVIERKNVIFLHIRSNAKTSHDSFFVFFFLINFIEISIKPNDLLTIITHFFFLLFMID
jgi:hypothetical protein